MDKKYKKYKDAITEFGERFVTEEDPEFDGEELHEAITTGHLLPEDLGETFISSVLESLGLENNLAQRREDKIQKVLVAMEPYMIFMYKNAALAVPSTAMDRRNLAEEIVDNLEGKSTQIHDEETLEP